MTKSRIEAKRHDFLAYLDRELEKDRTQRTVERFAVLTADAMNRLFPKLPRSSLDRIREVYRILSQPPSETETEASFNGFMARFVFGLWANPEWCLDLGYDAVRFAAPLMTDPKSGEALSDYSWLDETVRSSEELLQVQVAKWIGWQTHLREPGGVWRTFVGAIDALLPPQAVPGEGESRSLEDWAALLREGAESALGRLEQSSEESIVLPSLGANLAYSDSCVLRAATRRVLSDIAGERKELSDISWRTLEELVAELLFDLGLNVEITNRSWDGGRDVIARGELIPGEPSLLAVEVKHRKVVPVSEVRKALWANRHFPALLFVTSGRFSAGIYRERLANEAVLRLYLKDGASLEQWIDQYAQRHYQLGSEVNR